jgi:hypothetical protein
MRRILFSLIFVFLISGAASAQVLSEALDTTLVITTGGGEDWFLRSASSFYDGDAARSGSIPHGQESWMRTTIDGTGTLSFQWKVSSEQNYDFLEFYIDGELQDRISGSGGFRQMTYDIDTEGLHTLEWRYVKDNNISHNDDCGWVDQLEWTGAIEPSAGPLSEALETDLTFTTNGDAGWFWQTSMAFFDGDAAQSGEIFDDQESLIQTTITGAGTFSFYWKVSSEAGYDFLEFYIDGVLQERISGLVDWHQMVYEFVDSGVHALEWRYVKDYSESAGDDSGWIDLVEWSGGGTQPPVVGPLSQALDTSLGMTTDGDEEWFSQTDVAYFDGDAVQSGAILDNQESLIHTTITGEGLLSFYWKVSSEAGYDFLEFYIDGVLQDRISGTTDWQEMMYTITGADVHTLDWRYVKDKSVSSGSDSGWVDQLEWSGEIQPPSGGPLSEAMDTNLSFTTAGESDWILQTATTYFDEDAAQSGDVGDNQESLMQTLVSGTGTFSFYWKVSSEAGYDFLEFYIDGALQDRISGAEDWHQMIYTITEPGSHSLEWRYVKDYSVSEGEDSGWVDLVEWTGSGQPPSGGPLSDAMDTSLNFITGDDAEWFSQTAMWYFNGDAAQSGIISDNQGSMLQTTVDGAGMFSFYWKISSEDNYDFLEFYIDSSLQDRISGTQDWHQMVYTIDEPGSHTLEWRYVKDWSESKGEDSGWVDQVEWSGSSQPPSSNALSDAMETSLSFTTGGNSDWFYQTTTFYNDMDAAQSGIVSHNQESWMQTTVSGANYISFYWKVSSENGYDLLEFYIDGSLQDSISGVVDWQQIEYQLSPDSHELKWRYVKDWSVSEEEDAGWVDVLVVD